MNTRDTLTILGGLCTAIGVPLIAMGPNTTAWWIGIVLSAAGPSLMASRALIKDPEK